MDGARGGTQPGRERVNVCQRTKARIPVLPDFSAAELALGALPAIVTDARLVPTDAIAAAIALLAFAFRQTQSPQYHNGTQ